MALNLLNTCLRIPTPPNSLPFYKPPPLLNRFSSDFLFLLFLRSLSSPRNPKSRAYVTEETDEAQPEEFTASTLTHDGDLLARVSAAKDSEEALGLIAERSSGSGGVVGASDCCLILVAAIGRNNVELAMSVFSAMRRSLEPKEMDDKDGFISGWRWARPDARTYACMVRELASIMRVSDAIQAILDVAKVDVSPAEEVPFGTVVRCPCCMIAIAVAQPQHGTQVASCSKCRYQYELVSGDIGRIESEEISMEVSVWEKGLRSLQILKTRKPAAVHSIVVRTPAGISRTHRFATQTVELPAQEGERVTICLSAPSSSSRAIGPLKLTPSSPKHDPGEPLSIKNHLSGTESELLQVPDNNRNSFFWNPTVFLPLAAVLGTGDAASGFINPDLPRLIAAVVAASFVFSSAINGLVLPQLKKLPQRAVDAVAIKQKLLAQYDVLQNRIRGLVRDAQSEVWMLARTCQLENKMVAVGEPSYRARKVRVKKARENLEKSLMARIELLYNFAKLSSMIEIEVEMDSGVLVSEAVINAENISEQIEHIMELENLEQQWREQVEANDELERLLTSQTFSGETL